MNHYTGLKFGNFQYLWKGNTVIPKVTNMSVDSHLCPWDPHPSWLLMGSRHALPSVSLIFLWMPLGSPGAKSIHLSASMQVAINSRCGSPGKDCQLVPSYTEMCIFLSPGSYWKSSGEDIASLRNNQGIERGWNWTTFLCLESKYHTPLWHPAFPRGSWAPGSFVCQLSYY